MSPDGPRVIVVDRDAGRRLDVVVGELEEVGSRAEAQRLIEAGRVLVDGRRMAKRHLLAPGERVEVRPQPPAPTDLESEDLGIAVVYEDEHLLIVDKPAGIVTHPSRGHPTGTLVHGLLGRIAGGDDPVRPGIVHRLDRDTSGLLIVARTPRAHRRLQRMMRDRAVDRRYLALVHGAFPPAMTIDRPVGRDPRSRVRMTTATARGREAVTHLRRLEELGPFTLLEARLESGRTHQVRVHLESMGHPVVGDQVYGRRAPDLGLRRQFLHACRLAFQHPETGEELEFESPLPQDLTRALEAARRG